MDTTAKDAKPGTKAGESVTQHCEVGDHGYTAERNEQDPDEGRGEEEAEEALKAGTAPQGFGPGATPGRPPARATVR